MRFHHSTRRGRTKFSQAHGPSSGVSGARGHSALSNRWAQLSYCRQTNIHFNRRLPVTVPDELRNQRRESLECALEEENDEIFNRDDDNDNDNERPIEQQFNQKLHLEDDGNNDLQEAEMSDEIATRGGRKKAPPSTSANASAHANAMVKNNNRTTATTTAQAKLDIESAREKLIAQVDKHPFWSNKAAKRMRLLDIDERRILIYELTSYCERRDLEWRYEPYRGGLIGCSSSTGSNHSTPTGGGGGGGGGAARRMLSSVSERVPPTHAATDDAITATLMSRQQQLHNSSMSQPVSPMRESLPVEEASRLLSYSATGSAAHAGGTPPSQSGSSGIGSGLSQRRAHIRRSFSTTSGGGGVGGPATTGSSPPSSPRRILNADHAGREYQQTSGSFGEPRPLPSASLVWSIEPPEHLRPAPFASYLHTTEVPDTSFVKRCHGCLGRGRLKCTSCYGVGYEVCISCSGKGTMKSLASAAGSTSGHAPCGGRDSPGGAVVGSMWADGSESSSSGGARFGSSRHDEPGGISGGGAGSSAWTTESCHFCHGAGQKRCWICAGRAYNTCTACAGIGQLRCYLNLNITWMNHRDEFVLNNTDSIIPRDRLKLTSGLVLVDQQAWRLEPIGGSGAPMSSIAMRLASLSAPPPSGGGGHANNHANDSVGPDGATSNQKTTSSSSSSGGGGAAGAQQQTLSELVKPNELSQLNSLSFKLLEKHTQAYERDERLLRQRQRVTQIEAHLVNWEWKRRRGHFVIYGDERKVYIDKYPFKSVCNIT